MKSKKLPKLNEQTKILSFDLESNGLHGDTFAVAAIVVDASGKVYEQFMSRADIVGKVDEWVQDNVLGVITDMEVTHSSYKHLRDNFWAWFVKAQEQSDYVLVNNGYPVEYRFLLQCQDDDVDNRYWEHPFPILELTSLLVGAGLDVQEVKTKIMLDSAINIKGSSHNPLYDSKVAAAAAFKAFGL